MSIAVIGGGAFGAMTAIRLAEQGDSVSLFERLPGLMQGASANANRLHLGFHYPRDEETARQCIRGFQRFRAEFGDAVLPGVANAYFIAAEGTLTAPAAFLAFCDRMKLAYSIVDPAGFEPSVTNVQLGVMTDEVTFDADILRVLMIERLRRAGVAIHCGCEITDISREPDGFSLGIAGGGRRPFRAVVNCTYLEINRLTAQLGHGVDVLQYEYTAAAIVQLDSPAPASITVLDGPFMTLLPFSAAGDHLLYHVENSVIARADARFVNPGWLDPEMSPFAAVERERWFERLVASCSVFVPALRNARLKSVVKGPRVVLAGRESTDARPSIVRIHEPGYITAFSGKVDHCMWVAEEVAAGLTPRPMPGRAVREPSADAPA